MTSSRSFLYTGAVAHRRLRPRKHMLRYSLFELLVDLDEWEERARNLHLLSLDRFNLLSLRQSDYGPAGEGSLRARMIAFAHHKALAWTTGSIRLLTMPRILGYGFNPLSIFFYYDQDERLTSVVYEVHNTFGEKHFYAFDIPEGEQAPFRQHCAKDFYVSPFLEMDMTYDFHLRPPEEEFALSILDSDREGLVLTANMKMERQPLTDKTLLRAFLAFPFLTLKVIAGIHWEALKLWIKGVKLVPKPGASSGHGPASGH